MSDKVLIKSGKMFRSEKVWVRSKKVRVRSDKV